MLIKHPKGITETEITEMAKDARGQVNRIYLHWTAGYYGQAYNDYHFCVDREGQVYRHCRELTERKEHTWLRNSGAVAIALCCGAEAACWAPQEGNCRTARGALVTAGYVAPDCARICLGDAPPTVPQIEVMAKLVALLCDGLGLPICRHTARLLSKTGTVPGAVTLRPGGTCGSCRTQGSTAGWLPAANCSVARRCTTSTWPGRMHLPPRNGEAVQIQRACKTACGRIVGPAGVGRWSCKSRNGNCEGNGRANCAYGFGTVAPKNTERG